MTDSLSKTCRKCGETKPVDDFHRHADCLHGRTNTCKKCRNGHYREFRQEHKDRYAAHQRRYRAEGRNVEKRRVYKVLQNALERGDLVKPDTCQRCGSDGRIEGHHPDYSKPLEVMWLCPTCHAAQHQARAAIESHAGQAYEQAQLEFWSARERAA